MVWNTLKKDIPSGKRPENRLVQLFTENYIIISAKLQSLYSEYSFSAASSPAVSPAPEGM